MWILQIWLFLFKIVVAALGPLHSQTNFKIRICFSAKKEIKKKKKSLLWFFLGCVCFILYIYLQRTWFLFFLFFPFLHLPPPRWHMEFPGQGSDLNHSYDNPGSFNPPCWGQGWNPSPGAADMPLIPLHNSRDSKVDILTILNLSVHEYAIGFHLFSFLKFSCQSFVAFSADIFQILC